MVNPILAGYKFQTNISVIMLYMSGQDAKKVLDSVKRNWSLENKSIMWIASDQWGTGSYFLKGLSKVRPRSCTLWRSITD